MSKAGIQQTISLKWIGPVVLRRSERARNLNIRIKPFHGVRVSVPLGMSFKQAEKIVKSRQDWITRHLVKIKTYEQKTVIYDGTKSISTRHHRLIVLPWTRNEIDGHLGQGKALVRYPTEYEVTHPDVQGVIRETLREAYRKEAKSYLPQRLAQLAGNFGFRYRQVFIKNHRSRWGSCSAVNNINLSLHLMRLPDELVDYVILHELVHTEIKNHSQAFWTRLAEVSPECQKLRKRLRKFDLPFVL